MCTVGKAILFRYPATLMLPSCCHHVAISTPGEADPSDGGPSSSTYGFPQAASSPTYKGPSGYGGTKAGTKPLTLRAAVKACDVEAVQRALQKLEGNSQGNAGFVEAALDATDGMGRTLLHLAAAQPLRSGTDHIVQMLLSHRARPGVPDANDQSPLALSMAAVAAEPAALATASAASAVISSLLNARAEVVGSQHRQRYLQSILAVGPVDKRVRTSNGTRLSTS